MIDYRTEDGHSLVLKTGWFSCTCTSPKLAQSMVVEEESESDAPSLDTGKGDRLSGTGDSCWSRHSLERPLSEVALLVGP